MLYYDHDMDSVQKQLEELGLSQNEVKAYLAALELGAATAQQIAAKAAVVRPTAYVAIGGLQKRGLMSSHTRGKKQYFQAERPGQLMRLIEEEKKNLAARESKLKSMLPGLEALIAMAGEKPEVKYYEGLEGLEAMRKVLIDYKPSELFVIGNSPASLDSQFQEAHQVHGHRLKNLGVKMRVISINGDLKRLSNAKVYFGSKNGRRNSYEFKILKRKEESNGEIAIFGEYLSLVSYNQHPYGFLIKSKDLVQTCKLIFGSIWDSLR